MGTERNDWKNNQEPDQQLFTKDSENYSIDLVYRTCEPSPNLSSLDKYRDDGVPCLKFYSYPKFFVEQWIKVLFEMML